MTFYFSEMRLFAVRINVIILFQVQKKSNSVELQAQEVYGNMKDFDLSKLRLAAKHDEPYDTEDLNTVPDGYR